MMINSIYYSSYATWTPEYFARLYSYYNYELWLLKYKDMNYDQNFQKYFYDVYSKKPGVYVFIVTNEQLPFFLLDIERVGMTKNLIKQVKPAVNVNYPENGFNLNMFIYEFKEDDHV